MAAISQAPDHTPPLRVDARVAPLRGAARIRVRPAALRRRRGRSHSPAPLTNAAARPSRPTRPTSQAAPLLALLALGCLALAGAAPITAGCPNNEFIVQLDGSGSLTASGGIITRLRSTCSGGASAWLLNSPKAPADAQDFSLTCVLLADARQCSASPAQPLPQRRRRSCAAASPLTHAYYASPLLRPSLMRRSCSSGTYTYILDTQAADGTKARRARERERFIALSLCCLSLIHI